MNDQTSIDDKTPLTQEAWRTNLAKIGEDEGFYEELGTEHTALFVERGKTLIVTFENLDHVYDRGDEKMPWGYDFVTSRGWSMLGMMAHDWTWYRDRDVLDFFDRLRDQGFFRQFDKVVFYGASMGAYAAATFSAAAPGATVICISPQATLDRDVASWETRYRKAWRRNYRGRYGYAPDMIRHADAVHLFFDPRAPLDAMHAALFRGANVWKYNCRFMGHRIASLWLQLGILKPVVEGCVDGSLTQTQFYQLLRRRRENNRYQKEMLQTLEKADRPCLLIRYCGAVLARRRAPHFPNAMKAAQTRVAKKG